MIHTLRKGGKGLCADLGLKDGGLMHSLKKVLCSLLRVAFRMGREVEVIYLVGFVILFLQKTMKSISQGPKII